MKKVSNQQFFSKMYNFEPFKQYAKHINEIFNHSFPSYKFACLQK